VRNPIELLTGVIAHRAFASWPLTNNDSDPRVILYEDVRTEEPEGEVKFFFRLPPDFADPKHLDYTFGTVVDFRVANLIDGQCAMSVQKRWSLDLTKYERDNLLQLLNLIGFPITTQVKPFEILNTGDWVGSIGSKLVRGNKTSDCEIKPTDRPNKSRHTVIVDLEYRYGIKQRKEPHD